MSFIPNMLRTLLFFALILFISSCSTSVISLKHDRDIYLQEDEGYLLLAVDTSTSLNKIYIKGEKNITLTEQDLEAGTNYILVNLPAGNYTFDNVKLNYYWRLSFEEDIWDFQVKPSSISYIGHLTLKNIFGGYKSKLALENKSTNALEFMEEKFPKILLSKKMIYGGKDPDKFFDLVLREVRND